MAIISRVTSFRSASDSRAFIVHVGEEEYLTVDESVLCTRFRLLESTLLVEREDFDNSGAISNTVYMRPISTKRGWQYRVGAGSYTVIGVESRFSISQASALSPQSMYSIGRHRRQARMSPMPPVVEVLEHSVHELSSDDNSIATTVILGSDSEERIVIISSGLDLSHRVTQGLSEDTPSHSIERLMKSTYSPTSCEPSQASETPWKSTIQKTLLHSTSPSVDYAVGGNGLGTPVSSAGTPIIVQPRHFSSESGIRYEGVGEGSDSAVLSIYDSLLSL